MEVKSFKSEFSNAYLRIEGDLCNLNQLKERLTIFNRGLYYQCQDIEGRLKYWSSRLRRDPDNIELAETVQKMSLDLSEKKSQIRLKMFEHDEDGLFIPAGYWNLTESDGHHFNTEIKPFYLDILRPYQKECVEEVLKYKRATFVMATGLGKTITAISILLSAVKSGKRVIFIAPSKTLVDQIVGEVKRFHDDVTGCYSGKNPKIGSDVLVCTYGSAFKYADNYDVCIIDETQHSPVKSITSMLSNAQKIEYVYAMTATAFREDGLDLAIHAFTGPVVFERDLDFGISNNYLEHFDVYVIKIYSKKFRIRQNWSRASAYKRIMEQESVLGVISKYIADAIGKKRRVICLFKTLPPVRALSKKNKHLKVKGASADFKKPIDDFKANQISCILATNKLLSEGVDVPGADVLILGSMHSSNIVTYQAIGRVLRKGGKKPIIIDINLMGYENFDKSLEKRLKIYQKHSDSCIVKDIRL